MKAMFLILFVSLCGVVNADFLGQMESLSSRRPIVQRLMVSSKIKQARNRYVKWLNKSSDQEFYSHLNFSHFGKKLYALLSETKERDVNKLKQAYIKIVNDECDKMIDFVRSYFSSHHYNSQLYKLSRGYVDYYLGLFERVKGEEGFRAGEKQLVSAMKKLKLSGKNKEMLKILLFVQFQLMQQ
jgi:hypothetical protein